jgi:hypothetical protein
VTRLSIEQQQTLYDHLLVWRNIESDHSNSVFIQLPDLLLDEIASCPENFPMYETTIHAEYYESIKRLISDHLPVERDLEDNEVFSYEISEIDSLNLTDDEYSHDIDDLSVAYDLPDENSDTFSLSITSITESEGEWNSQDDSLF